MKHQLGVFVLVLAVPLAARAQTTGSSNETELINTLLSRIEHLERRVAELEGSSPKAPSVGPVAVGETDTKPLRETIHQADQRQAVSPEAQPTYPSLKISGFSDINFSATDQPRTKSGFSEGQFVLHLSSALAPNVSYFGEVSLTARTDAGRGTPSATGFNAEVERTILRYDYADYLKVSFGRYHTPINWWNTAFHHGQWLQTTVSRPEMTQFGGRFIPVHFIGGLLEGALPAYGLNLNYNVGMGNGRSVPISRSGDFGDINNNRAWLINLFLRPDRFYGLQVGASFYRDKIKNRPASEITLGRGGAFREWIAAGHIVWEREDPELIAEIANINHRAVGSESSFNSQAFYIQAGYRLPWFDEVLKPYYRFEYIHTERGDPVWQTSGSPLDLRGHVLGLRYDFTNFAALKLEYRNQDRPLLPRINGLFIQSAFTF